MCASLSYVTNDFIKDAFTKEIERVVYEVKLFLDF